MRLARYALLLIPLAILIAWFAGIRGLSVRGIFAFALLIGVLGGVLYFAGNARVFSGPYQPAHLQDGRIVAAPAR